MEIFYFLSYFYTMRKKHLIAPSILAADFTHLARDIEFVNQSEADWLHVDVMDGWTRWWDIQERTGVSQERAEEIAEIVQEVFKEYAKRNLQAEGDA